MQNVSFQGKTSLLLSNKKYSDFYERSRIEKRTFLLESTRECRLIAHRVFHTNTDNGDVVIMVKNDREGYMKKIPLGSELSNIKDLLEAKIELLKKNSGTEKLTAWIFGGDNYKYDKGKTIETVNSLWEVLERPDIDTSILAGPKKAMSGDIVIHGKIGETEIFLPKHIEDTNDLDNLYDIVELNNVECLTS